MSRDSSELHDIDPAGEPRERVRACIMEMQIDNQELVAGLAKQCVEAGAGYRPGETIAEWFQKAQSVLGQGDFAWTPGEVFRFMRDAGNATVGVYPRGSEGEDLSGSHASTEAQEKGESYFATLGPWPFPRSKPEVPEQTPNLQRMYDALAGWVVTRGAEATEGSVATPLPFIPSDGKYVAEEVDVALDASFADYLQSLVAPLSKVRAVNAVNEVRRQLRELADQGIYPLDLESAPALLGADLVPVPLERFPKAVLGNGATLHRQNLGLLRGGPSVAGTFGLEGARLANSVPRDLDLPSVLDASDVGHRRKSRREADGNNRD